VDRRLAAGVVASALFVTAGAWLHDHVRLLWWYRGVYPISDKAALARAGGHVVLIDRVD
jgi:hypothetical protein